MRLFSNGRLGRAGRHAPPVVVAMTMLVAGLSATPVAHAAGPKITVTPDTGLVTGQTVTVAGSGFFAKEDLVALECPHGSSDPLSCDVGDFVEVVTNGQGRFSTTLPVRRTIVTPDGFTDCAPAACDMVFADSSNFNDDAVAPMKFDAGVALPKTSVNVTPSTGLADRQTVTIGGKGFTADREAFAVECITGSFTCVGGFAGLPNASGQFSITGSVHRDVPNMDGNPVDCAGAAGTCEMVAYDPLDADYHSSTPLEFDPNAPPPPSPTATVDPAAKLPYYARVSVRGKHWSAGDLVALMECPNASDPLNCFNILGFAIAGGDGRLKVDPMLSRKVLDEFSGTVHDCAKHNDCSFVAQDFSDGSTVVVPISFDPHAPIPPRATVKLSPAGPYANRQIVTVQGRNFAPDALFDASECFSSRDAFGCFLPKRLPARTDANGDFSTQVKLHRLIDLGGETIDCADPSVQCTMSSSSEGGVGLETPLVFGTGAAAGTAASPSALTFTARHGGWAAALPPACSGMRLSPHITRALAAHPRARADVCAAWAQARSGS